MILLALKGQLA